MCSYSSYAFQIRGGVVSRAGPLPNPGPLPKITVQKSRAGWLPLLRLALGGETTT